jgi:hypothetical protein
MPSSVLSKRSSTVLGAVAGVVAAVVALGVAELIAGARQEWRSPVIDVGDRVIDNVPPFVKNVAIETFGTTAKPALLIGIGAMLMIYAAVVEHDIALTCVSNTVGGELVGNARWRGVRLDELLADAGVDPRRPRSSAARSTAIRAGSRSRPPRTAAMPWWRSG